MSLSTSHQRRYAILFSVAGVAVLVLLTYCSSLLWSQSFGMTSSRRRRPTGNSTNGRTYPRQRQRPIKTFRTRVAAHTDDRNSNANYSNHQVHSWHSITSMASPYNTTNRLFNLSDVPMIVRQTEGNNFTNPNAQFQEINTIPWNWNFNAQPMISNAMNRLAMGNVLKFAEAKYTIQIRDLSPWQPWVYNTTKCTEEQWLAREVHLNRSRVLRALRGKHIVMIGDSVTRYQYLNLVYYLRTGSWGSPMPRNEREHDHGNWLNFFRTTNTRLSTEVCDCYRSEAWDPETIRENRYYHDVANDIRVSVVLQLGLNVNVTLHTPEYLSAQCTPERCVQSGCGVGRCALNDDDTASHYPALRGEDVWLHVPALLGATHAIINQGIWVFPEEAKASERQFATVMHSVAQHHPEITHVWKTTTPTRESVYRGLDVRDRHIVAECNRSSTWGGGASWRVFDVARFLPVILNRAVFTPLFMYDDLHYSSDVNSAMNQALLGEMLGSSVFSSDVFECRK